MQKELVIPFPGSLADRLANAARSLARQTKDEEAIEAALFLEPSPIVVVKAVPSDDEHLRDFLVRPGILRTTANDNGASQIVVYVAQDAPQDFWFEAYALAAGRTVRNLVCREEWEPLLTEGRPEDLKTATAVAQFEALSFVLRQICDLGRVQYADLAAFRRHLAAKGGKHGDGSRALEFLPWCVEGNRVPAPHRDVRVQAAMLLRFFFVLGQVPLRGLTEITEALAG